MTLIHKESYELRVQDDGFVEVTFTKPTRIEQSLGALAEALAASKTTPRRVLFDVTKVSTEDTRAEQFKFSLKAQSTGLRSSDRVAALIEPHSTEHDFVEDAMHSAGYPNFRAFRDPEKAHEFLREE